jgi:phage antirepressor YoqD-like protein
MKTDTQRIWIASFVFLFVLSIFQPSYGDMTAEQALEAVRTGKWDKLPSLIVTPVMEDVKIEGVATQTVMQNFSTLVQASGIKNYVKPGLADRIQEIGQEEMSKWLLEQDKIHRAVHTYVFNEFEVQPGAGLYFDMSANIICRRFVLRKGSKVIRPKNSILRIIALEKVESEEGRIDAISGGEDGTMEADGVTYTIKVGASGAGGEKGENAEDEGQAAEGQSATEKNKGKNGKNGKDGKDGGEVLIISKTLKGNLFVDVTGGDGGRGGNGGKGMDGGFGSPGLDGQDEKTKEEERTRTEVDYEVLENKGQEKIQMTVEYSEPVMREFKKEVCMPVQYEEEVPYEEQYTEYSKVKFAWGLVKSKIPITRTRTAYRTETKTRTECETETENREIMVPKTRKVDRLVDVVTQTVETVAKEVKYKVTVSAAPATKGSDGEDGGNGANGGDGEKGGDGGNGGNVTLIIQDTGGYKIHVFTEGGKGGIGGLGGRGGSGGIGGQGGKGGRRFNYQTGKYTDARAPAGKNGLKGKDGVAGVSGESGESGETGDVKMIVDVPDKIWELAATSYIEKQLLGKVPQDAAITRPIVGKATDPAPPRADEARDPDSDFLD